MTQLFCHKKQEYTLPKTAPHQEVLIKFFLEFIEICENEEKGMIERPKKLCRETVIQG